MSNTIFLKRYDVVSRYMNNQTDEGWAQFITDVQALECKPTHEVSCNTVAESSEERSRWAKVLRDMADRMETVNKVAAILKKSQVTRAAVVKNGRK